MRLQVVSDSAKIIRSFVEEYHEKLEAFRVKYGTGKHGLPLDYDAIRAERLSFIERFERENSL